VTDSISPGGETHPIPPQASVPDPLDPDVGPNPLDPIEEPLVVPDDPITEENPALSPVPNLVARKSGARSKAAQERAQFNGAQRLLILDLWRRSALPAADFAELVGCAKHTLYAWNKAFEVAGPAGLMDHPRGAKKGTRVAEHIKRAILMMHHDHPEWGYQRLSDMLERGPEGLGVSGGTVERVLREAGIEPQDRPEPAQPHRDHIRFFERAKPNQLWQTDLFTFMLKRQNRRVHLVGFMDDHSRFIVSYGLHATASASLVIEVLRAGIASYQAPEEVLTDNGSQYITWRGSSRFHQECETRGIKHILSAPQHPQTLGKVERFWGTLWKECLHAAVFVDLEDARRRIGHFIDYYNFQRTHSGIGGLVPADRFFNAAPEVLKTLKARVDAKAHSIAVNGVPKEPLYLTGQVGGQSFSVHSEGERVILTSPEGRKEIDLVPPSKPATQVPAPQCPHAAPASDGPEDGMEEPPMPGVSPLDPIVPPTGTGAVAL